MFRSPSLPSPLELRKWGVYALLLLAPGSFVLLPAYWLVRRLTVAPRTGKGNGS